MELFPGGGKPLLEVRELFVLFFAGLDNFLLFQVLYQYSLLLLTVCLIFSYKKFEMRLSFFLNFSVSLFLMNNVFGQSVDNTTFNIIGKIIGRDTGIVVLYYTDNENKFDKDTAIVKNGQFGFTGKVNRVSDAHLWTDTSNRNFSDRSVVRFLLGPENINIIYNDGNATIKGSKTQVEKENFDMEKSDLVIPR